MASIYLIRHGQASLGTENYDVLSPLGIKQAKILGQYFSQIGLYFDQCYSGSLERQKDTAKYCLNSMQEASLPVPQLQIDTAFDEMDADAIIHAMLPRLQQQEPDALAVLRAPLQNKLAFQRVLTLAIEQWLSTDTQRLPHALHWQTFVSIVEQGFRRILMQQPEHENIAVFTSAGTITAFLHILTGLVPADAFELNWQIVNTSFSRIAVHGDSAKLAFFNSHAHLDLLKSKSLLSYY